MTSSASMVRVDPSRWRAAGLSFKLTPHMATAIAPLEASFSPLPSVPTDQKAGVYVHFPWCLQKCGYCDFLSVATPREAIEHAKYADAVVSELERRTADLGRRTLGSVFFGGGTPSLWEPRELGRVLQAVRHGFAGGTADVEVTVECNPSSLDERRAAALLDQGVNRLSIGVQGLDDERLQFLGRLHDGRGALEAVRTALRAGVPRV